jgi:hypothetical protein
MSTCIHPDPWLETPAGVGVAARYPAAERIEASLLGSWIDEEIEWLKDRHEEVYSRAIAQPETFLPMLRLLCLAYATGEAETSQIVQVCRRDPGFRATTAGFVPFPQELRHFRRRHRALLETLLARVFMRLAFSDKSRPIRRTSRALQEYFEARAREVLDLARHLDSCDE